MFFRTKSNADTANECGGEPIPDIPLDVIQSHIMTKLDGATLASALCASPQLFSLCNNDQTWRKICNYIWPSTTDPSVLHAISTFPSAHRSFFFDSSLSTSYLLPRLTCLSETSELISAVDIYYKDEVIYSKALRTQTVSDWFFTHSFTLNLLSGTERVPTPLQYDGHERRCKSLAEEHLRVSWIVIDSYSKRAVNIASHKAVASKILANGDIDLCYATVAALATEKMVKFAVGATCVWMGREMKLLQVKSVKMEIRDVKRSLNGRESLRILQAAMEGRRRRIDCKTEKDAYRKFFWKELEFIIFAAIGVLLFMLSFPILNAYFYGYFIK